VGVEAHRYRSRSENPRAIHVLVPLRQPRSAEHRTGERNAEPAYGRHCPGHRRDRIDLGQSRQQAVAWWLVPGRYDVHFEALAGAEVAPANPETRLQANRSIVAGSQIINVPTVVVQGDFLVGGEPAPGSVLESGRVFARDRHTGRDVQLGQTDFATYQRRIIPGVYDLAYRRVAGSAAVPANGDVVFQSARALTSGTAADIDVPIADMHLQMTLDGAMFPALNLERAALWLRSPADVEFVYGGQTSMFETGPHLLLTPGSYAVSLSHLTGSALIPRNSFARLAPAVLVSPSSPGTANLDVRTGAYDLRVSLDGAPFPLGDDRRAALELRHFEDAVDLGSTDAPLGTQLLATSVAPGEDGRHGTIYYRWLEGHADELPQNIDSPAAGLVFEPL
jgi:hypothetical protein